MLNTFTRNATTPLMTCLAGLLALSLSACPLLLIPQGQSATAPPNISEKIHAVQNNLIQNQVTGSNVVLVVKNGETIYHEVVNSGKQGDRDITEDTIFPIWSMSKPITIVAMMTLHEQGLFDWNDPVSEYLPCFENLTVREGEGVRDAKKPLLIKHLMAHRSGYIYYSFPEPMPPPYESPHPNQTRYQDLQEFVEAAAREPLMFEPGTSFAYGINQAILGRLVEALSGQSFYDYLKQTLFDPLGMTQTSFALDENRRKRFQPLFINSGQLKGFTSLLDELTYTPASQAHFGGEGLVSTLGDYSRFCEMLVNGGEFRGERIISEESIATMTKTTTPNFDPIFMPGFDMGFSVAVCKYSSLEGTKAPVGLFGWSGYHNTHFWIDQATGIYAIFMSRAREFNFNIPRELRAAIYGSSNPL